MYGALKIIHVTSVAVSIGLFVVRLMWTVTAPHRLELRWVRIVPHIIDTVLLASAIALTFEVHQYPFVDAWLTAKVCALVGYIICGSLALKRARTRFGRQLASVGALLCVAYILAVALTHDPFPIPRGFV